MQDLQSRNDYALVARLEGAFEGQYHFGQYRKHLVWLPYDKIDSGIQCQHSCIAINVRQSVKKDGQIVTIIEILRSAVPAQWTILGGVLLVAATGEGNRYIATQKVNLEHGLLNRTALKYVDSVEYWQRIELRMMLKVLSWYPIQAAWYSY